MTISNAQKQRNRQARLNKAAQLAGYATIDQLVKAILNGEVVVVQPMSFEKYIIQEGSASQ